MLFPSVFPICYIYTGRGKNKYSEDLGSIVLWKILLSIQNDSEITGDSSGCFLG
jgi:hypothetical protein